MAELESAKAKFNGIAERNSKLDMENKKVISVKFSAEY